MGQSKSKEASSNTENIEEIDIDHRISLLNLDMTLVSPKEWIQEGKECLMEGDLRGSFTAFTRAHLMVDFLINTGALKRRTCSRLLEIQAHLCNCLVRLDVALDELDRKKLESKSDPISNADFKKSLKIPEDALLDEDKKCESEKSEDGLAIEKLIASLEVCKPKMDLTEVIGQEQAITAITDELFYQKRYPTEFEQEESYSGIMFYGPPGNGKTTIAKAAATLCGNTPFFKVSVDSLLSKWKGQSEKAVRALFKIAQLNGPSIVFIDEVEALFQSRSGSDGKDNVGTGLVQLFLDMVSTYNKVYLLCATNCPWEVDEAFYRRYRPIYITMPTREERLILLKKVFNKKRNHLLVRQDFEEICDMTEGFSFDDLNKVHSLCITFLHNFTSAANFMKPTINKRGRTATWTPCHKYETGAIKIKAKEIPDTGRIGFVHQPITRAVVNHIIDGFHPTVSKETIEKNDTFCRRGLDGLKDMRSGKQGH